MSRRRKSVTQSVKDDFEKFCDYWDELLAVAETKWDDYEVNLPLSYKMMVAAYAAVTWVAQDDSDKEGGAKNGK